MGRGRVAALLLLLVAALAGCGAGGRPASLPAAPARGAAASTGAAAPPPARSVPARPGASRPPSAARAPAPSRPPSAARAPAASPHRTAAHSAGRGRGAVAVIGRGFGQPDDLVAAPDGAIYFGDFAGGRIGSLPPGGGAPRAVVSGLRSPEGLVVLPGGALAVAEQGDNRIVRVDPRGGRVSVIGRLVNATRLEGVDGLGWDAAAGRLIVPDSPNGRLLLMNPADGRTRVVVPRGLGRPTDAWALAGGGFLVADETGGRVLRVAGGRTATLARLPLPDDVVVARSGAVFVASLAGAVWEVAPVRRVVLGGLRDPQGLALAPGGASLLVVETGRDRILRLTVPAPGRPPLVAPPA